LCWGPDHRGAEGAEFETPKALREEGYGEPEEVSPSHPTRSIGEHSKLPSDVRGAPPTKTVLVHLELERIHLMAINFVFLRRIWLVSELTHGPHTLIQAGGLDHGCG